MYSYMLLLCLAVCSHAQKEDLDKISGDPVTRGAAPLPPSPPPTLAPGACQTPSGISGLCVPIYRCKNFTYTDLGGIDLALPFDEPCENVLDYCCLPLDILPLVDDITPAKKDRQGCGWRNPDGVGTTTSRAKESKAEFAEFPWMVAILKIEPVSKDKPDEKNLNMYIGGGSLIHHSVVLTSAHYVERDWPNKTIRCRAGEWDIKNTAESYPYQDRDVIDAKIHSDYNKGNLFYDIALLFLNTHMDFAPNVQLACLPPPKQQVPDGTRCFASGWGKDQFIERRYQHILKKVEVPVVNRNECQTALRQTRLGAFFQLHSSFMCAGGEKDKDACTGDGGSPLVCPIETEPGRYMQSGIVAWGIGCGADGVPSVYVDVSNLREWVDDAVAGKGYDTSVYTF